MKIILFLILLMFVIPVDASWWNTSWNFKTDNNIVNGTRPYQISLNVSNSTGTNNASHIFCNGKCNVNFTDIRFTLDNTTELPYWIENATTGFVWVNVTGNGTVNMYYNNPSATTTSSGSNTFNAFSEFCNINGFTELGAGSISNCIYTGQSSSGNFYGLYWNQSFGLSHSMVFWAKTDSSFSLAGWYDEIKNENYPSGTDFSMYQLASVGINYVIAREANGGSYEISITTAGGTEFIKSEIIRVDSASTIYKINNSIVRTETTNVPTVNLYPRFSSYSGDGSIDVDTFYVRDYASPEPVWTTWGEEQLITITISSYSVSTVWNSNIMSWNNSNTTWTIITPAANIQWFINGSLVQNDVEVISSSYSNSSAKIGNWNVTSIATNPSNSQSITWIWIVAESTPITKFEEVVVSIS